MWKFMNVEWMIHSQYLNHCINEGQVELVIIMLSMVLSQLMEILQLVVLRHLLNLQVGASIDALLTSALTPPLPSTTTTTICNIVCLLQVAWADRINLVVLVGVKWNMLKTCECVSEIVYLYIFQRKKKKTT